MIPNTWKRRVSRRIVPRAGLGKGREPVNDEQQQQREPRLVERDRFDAPVTLTIATERPAALLPSRRPRQRPATLAANDAEMFCPYEWMTLVNVGLKRRGRR